jgi:hypothetical protein
MRGEFVVTGPGTEPVRFTTRRQAWVWCFQHYPGSRVKLFGAKAKAKERIDGNGVSRTGESSAEDGPIVSALVRAADERDLALARARLRERMEAFDRGEELPRPNIAGRLWSTRSPPP